MSGWRDLALAKYERLGLDVFPYHETGTPWDDWPHPTAAAARVASEARVFGVVLGGHHVVVDVDADQGGDLAALEAEYGPLPPTMTVTTPSGERNMHLYFRVENELRTCKALTRRFPGIDFLGRGSHVKGATSRRKVAPYLAVAYVEQAPFLDPALLPAALREAWCELQPVDDRAEYREAYDAARLTAPVVADDVEHAFARAKIADALGRIRSGTDGNRHDVLFTGARDVFRWAVLTGKDPRDYDEAVRQAYAASGGRDFSELDRQIVSVRRWVLANPMHRPAVSARVEVVDPMIGEWADNSVILLHPTATKQRALVAALAAEARIEIDDDGRDAVMSTATTVLAERHPDVGTREEVTRNLRVLRQRGILVEVGENRVKLGRPVKRYALTA